MDKKLLQEEIKKLLKDSTISIHDKTMVKILLPVMDEQTMQNIYDSLTAEKTKMSQLGEKKKRIILKYQMLSENAERAKNASQGKKPQA